MSENSKTPSDQEIEVLAQNTGAVLKKEKKVRIKIPLNRKNPADCVVPVGINGYFYYINRGQSVEVPESVAQILSEAQYI